MTTRHGGHDGKEGKDMLKYELIIIWETGEKEIYEYHTEEQAEEIGQGMKMAFGNQVQWYGVRRKG